MNRPLHVLLWKAATLLNWNPHYQVGQEIDRLNGVAVFYNGGLGHTSGRNLAPDGDNLEVKHQCVEFMKRYEHLIGQPKAGSATIFLSW